MNDATMDALIAGVDRFQREVYPLQRERFLRLASQQQPEVLFLTCADSRIDPSLITQSRPGQLFIARNIGNVIPPHGTPDGSGIATVLEYAVDVLKVRHIVLCGHSNCGAMKSLLDPNDDADVPHTTAWLRFAETARRLTMAESTGKSPKELLEMATKQNVLAQLTHLRTFPGVAAGLASQQLQLHGWYYDIASGAVESYDDGSGSFDQLKGTTLRAGASEGSSPSA